MNVAPAISVILPTHNPHPVRLARTLAALRGQTLPATAVELVVVDNASSPALAPATLQLDRFPSARLVREGELGLSVARRRGLRETAGAVCVFVDDDNVLAPDYLERALALFAGEAQLGCAGGKSLPEFEFTPPDWVREFFPLLALRDLGDKPRIESGLRLPETAGNRYPDAAPIGAGMLLRRAAAKAWLSDAGGTLPDRRGAALSSGGDNDIVLCVLRAGWSVGYFPALRLTHLIPRERVSVEYLARLNRGVQESWMRVLRKHDANPWPPLTPLGAMLRQAKAWLNHQAWRGSAHRVRWHGACGHFAGRVN